MRSIQHEPTLEITKYQKKNRQFCKVCQLYRHLFLQLAVVSFIASTVETGETFRTLQYTEEHYRRICFSYWDSHVPLRRYYYNRHATVCSTASSLLSCNLLFNLEPPVCRIVCRIRVRPRLESDWLYAQLHQSLALFAEDASQTSFPHVNRRFAISFWPRWGEDYSMREVLT